MIFAYPKQAEFNRVLHKSKIYERGKPSRALRDAFGAQINQIVWKYKLAPETINLPSRPGVPEIEIFSLELKTPEVSENLLRYIDKVIPLPIFYNLSFNGSVKTVAAYKRPSDADASHWVVGSYFSSSWQAADGECSTLPVALDMAGLYVQMLRRLMPFPARPGETLKDHIERLSELRSKQAEYARLESRLHKEKQFNRKVELNSQMRTIKAELDTLVR